MANLTKMKTNTESNIDSNTESNTESDNFLESADQLYDLSQIDRALSEMALSIGNDFLHHTPLVIGIMNGAMVTLGHLLPKLNFLLEVDYCHATRYGDNTSGGAVAWLAYPQKSLKGRYVLLVDDIFDEGVTLQHIAGYCLAQGALEVKSAVLLSKQHQRKVDHFSVDYTALTIADRYVFGFGLDYKGWHRNAAGIFALPEA
jgi:hypoxanthine phosphoribosyltransferase